MATFKSGLLFFPFFFLSDQMISYSQVARFMNIPYMFVFFYWTSSVTRTYKKRKLFIGQSTAEHWGGFL